MELLRLEETSENINKVQKLFENAPRYFLNVSSEIAGLGDGEEAFKALPPNFSKKDKYILGIVLREALIGLVDCLIGYPSIEKAHIGLFLIDEAYQSKGFGKQAYVQLEEYLKSFPFISVVRLLVVDSNNEVLEFWRKMGFQITGEMKPYSNKQVNSRSIIMEKKLA